MKDERERWKLIRCELCGSVFMPTFKPSELTLEDWALEQGWRKCGKDWVCPFH